MFRPEQVSFVNKRQSQHHDRHRHRCNNPFSIPLPHPLLPPRHLLSLPPTPPIPLPVPEPPASSPCPPQLLVAPPPTLQQLPQLLSICSCSRQSSRILCSTSQSPRAEPSPSTREACRNRQSTRSRPTGQGLSSIDPQATEAIAPQPIAAGSTRCSIWTHSSLKPRLRRTFILASILDASVAADPAAEGAPPTLPALPIINVPSRFFFQISVAIALARALELPAAG